MQTETITRASTPTPKQLSYLRVLAARTGTTFSPPRTRRDASREISRLKRVLASAGSYQELPDRDREAETGYATAPARGEVYGRGAEASWRKPAPHSSGREVTRRALVASYEVAGTARTVYAERQFRGPLRLVDRPAGGKGRAYLIDRHLWHDGAGAIRALVEDYLRSAQRFDRIPMERESAS